MGKAKLAVVFAVAVVFGLLMGCGGSNDGSNGGGSGSSDGASRLVVAVANLFPTLEHDLSPARDTTEVVANTQATLIRNKLEDAGDGAKRQVLDEFEGVLADSWEVSDDHKTFTFKLKKGVMSHDGNELTADDVAYSIERKLGLGGVGTFLLDLMTITKPTQVTAVDDYTVQFKTPVAKDPLTFLSNLSNTYTGAVWDSDEIKKHVTKDDPWASKWFAANDQGFGPYELDSFVKGERAEFVAFKDFVLGAPKIKEVIQLNVPESSSRASLLKNGDVQVAEQLLPREQQSLKDTAYIPELATNSWVFLPLNYKHKPWDNKLVRQAMAQLVPWKEIIDNIYFGRATQPTSPLWDNALAYCNAGKWETNLEKAKALLAEAGYPDGFETTLTYEKSVPDTELVAVAIQGAAAAAGVKIKLNPQASSQFNESVINRTEPMLLRKDQAYVQTPSYALDLFFRTGSVGDHSFWANKDFMQLSDQWQKIADDGSPEAEKLFCKAQKLIYDESPYLLIAYPKSPDTYAKSVKGYTHRTDNVVPYAELSLGGE
jgi:peptide/nickel transport system substrate-binding protein